MTCPASNSLSAAEGTRLPAGRLKNTDMHPRSASTIVAALLVLLSSVSVSRADAPTPVTASSVFDPRYLPEYAIDGHDDTRWASRTSSPQPEWLQIDLGGVVPIPSLVIRWEHAYAAEYDVQASEDGQTWKTLHHETAGRDEEKRLDSLAGQGRYLRINCLKPGPFPLYSIWEVNSPDAALAQALGNAYRKLDESRQAELRIARERLVAALKQRGSTEIVFAVRKPGVDGHWYANFGYYAASTDQKLYRPGGARLCRLDLATGEARDILADPQGCVRDPQVHYDGRKIVFSYLKGGTSRYHLYEISADGTGLRQLTDGDCDDIEPTYVPDGGIVFCSSRCNRWVNCWLTPVAVLYRCDADGGNVRIISANVEQDNTPWVLPDGRILYMRWEYVDRSQVDYHHLWTANPDGTEQSVFYGNLHPSTAMLDAKPIPGTRQIVAVFSPGHGQQEHAGQITIVDPGDGPDDQAFARPISAGIGFRDPYPLGDGLFLVANGAELDLMDSRGVSQIIYRLPDAAIGEGLWCHEPRPLLPREREKVIGPRVDLKKATGRLLLLNAYDGRNMAGVKPGDIRKLLVLESLPKPINYTGGMDPLTYGGSFTLERVLGTVPVEPDGSAYLEVPALRSLFFVALDASNLSVKRMQSFCTVQPGEVTSCVGCHEPRTQTVRPSGTPLALQRPPSPIEPLAGLPQVFDFPRDIQPVLDRHCVRCHDYDPHDGGGPRAGGVILTGDRGPMFSHSYFELTTLKQFVDGRNNAESNLPPRTIGTSASPLMKKLAGEHHGVQLSPHETDLIRYWIEAGAPYPGTYGALGNGAIGGYYANSLTEVDTDWPATKAAGEAIRRRCVSCHTGPTALPVSLSDEIDLSFWRPDWNDPRLKHSRHIVFNLSRPEKSLMLLAPLSQTAGGYGLCHAADGAPTFADTGDADYGRILAMCVAGRERLETIKRFDMPGFRPPVPYLREMARIGVLSALPPEGQPVDTYALDEAYWRTQWFVPAGR